MKFLVPQQILFAAVLSLIMSMKIRNIEGLSAKDLLLEAEKGAKFIQYTYTISIIIFSYRRSSDVYMLRPGSNPAKKGSRFILISALFGWWGIPFGPKYTFESIRKNLKGGKDVTDEVMSTVTGHILFQEAQKRIKAHSV